MVYKDEWSKCEDFCHSCAVGLVADTEFFSAENSQKLTKIENWRSSRHVEGDSTWVMIAEFRDLRENCLHCAWKFDGIDDRVIRHVDKSSFAECTVQEQKKAFPLEKMFWRERSSVAFAPLPKNVGRLISEYVDRLRYIR
jgi:hypothetical protein